MTAQVVANVERKHERPRAFSAQNAYNLAAVTMPETAFLKEYLGTFQRGAQPLVIYGTVFLRRANSAKKVLVSRVFSLHDTERWGGTRIEASAADI